MSQDASGTTEPIVRPSQDLVFFQSVVAAVLKENCRKQEQDIQAIAESAYVTRHGRRELQDPKRLALAIRLRSNYMADFYAYASHIRDCELVHAFVMELVSKLRDVVQGQPPDLLRRIDHMLDDLTAKYRSLQRPAQSGQEVAKSGKPERKI